MQLHHLLFVLLINAIWGFNFVSIKFATVDFHPLVVSTLRFTMVFIALLPFFRWVPGRMVMIAAAGLTLGILHFGTFIFAIYLAEGAGAVSVLSQLHVPFATLLAFVFLGERFGIWRLAGIGMSLIGTMVLSFDPAIFAYFDAVIWILINAFVYASATIIMRQLRQVPALTTQAWVALIAVIGNFLLTEYFTPIDMETLKAASLSSWLGVAFSAFGATIVGHAGVNHLLRHYPVATVSPYLLLTPFFATAASMLVFGEQISLQFIVGASITMSGVLLVTLRAQKAGT